MAESVEPVATFCFTWNTKPPGINSFLESSDFLLLGAKCYLQFHYTFEKCYIYKIFLIRKTKTHTSDNTIYVTTFLEKYKLVGDLRPVTSCGSVAPLKSSKSTIIWMRNVSEMIQTDPSPFNGTYRVTCVFHDVASIDIQSKNQRSAASHLVDKPFSEKAVQTYLEIFDLESLSSDLKELLKNEIIPDVKLRSSQGIFSAHKAVLAARSEVFAAMFRNRMLESETGTVDIKDIDAPVLELLLEYMYSGKIEVVPDDKIRSLYEAGDKYAVLALKRTCSERLIENLTEDNCLKTLILFDVHDDSLKTVVMNFIFENDDVLLSEGWSKLNNEQPKLTNEVYHYCYVQRKIFSKKASK